MNKFGIDETKFFLQNKIQKNMQNLFNTKRLTCKKSHLKII